MAIFSKTALAALAVVLPATMAAHSKGTFAVLRFNGQNPLIEARMDPVVNPNEIAPHVHTIQGGNAFSFDMSADSISKATCTTAKINKDMSNYWAPKLYFKSPTNGTIYDVPLMYMNVYYFFDQTTDDIVPFEPGFQMLSGDASTRTPPKSAELQLDGSKPDIQPISWTCPQNTNQPPWPAGSDGTKIGMGAKAAQEGVGFPNKNCDGTYSPLRSNVHFPSCYKKSAGLKNYKENTAWPVSDGKGNMNCPDGHDHVPHLFYELYWQTNLFAGQWETGKDTQPFLLSNGDPTGYSLHADFVAGWDKGALQWVIDNCNAGSAGMDQCTGIPGGISNTDNKCTVPSPIEENVKGAMSALPGCNPIVSSGKASPVANCPKPKVNGNMQPAGTPAQSASSPSATSVSNSGSSPSSAPQQSSPPSYGGGSSQQQTTMATVTQPGATPAPASGASGSGNDPYAGIDWSKVDYSGVDWSKINYGSKKARRSQHLHKHRHAHEHQS